MPLRKIDESAVTELVGFIYTLPSAPLYQALCGISPAVQVIAREFVWLSVPKPNDSNGTDEPEDIADEDFTVMLNMNTLMMKAVS